MSLSVNGVSLAADVRRNISIVNGSITYEPLYPGIGQRVNIWTTAFNATTIAWKAYIDVVSGYNRDHFNLMLTFHESAAVLDGILGKLRVQRQESNLACLLCCTITL